MTKHYHEQIHFATMSLVSSGFLPLHSFGRQVFLDEAYFVSEPNDDKIVGKNLRQLSFKLLSYIVTEMGRPRPSLIADH